jgi:O-antigen/teichoic acid export membrane protein
VVLSFAAAVFAIRLLGAHEFGMVSAVLAHVALFHYALSMGLDHTLPVIDDAARLSRVTRLGLLTVFVCGTAGVLSAGVWAPVSDDLSPLVWMFGASVVFTAAGVVLSGYLRATRQFGSLMFKDQVVTPAGTLFASTLALAWFGSSATIYAIFYLLTAVLAAAFGFWCFVRSAPPAQLRSLVAERRFLAESTPTAITLVLENAVPFGIVAVVSYTLSAGDVGVFSTLQRFGQLTLFAGVAIAPIVSGVLTDHLRRSEQEGGRLFRAAILASLSWAVCMSCICIIFASEISSLIGLEETVPLSILVPLLLGFALDGGFGHVKLLLIAKNDGAANARMIAVAAAIAMLGAWVGTVFWGLAGASWALFAAYCVLTMLRFARVRSLTHLSPLARDDAGVLVMASTPVMLVTILSPMNAWSAATKFLLLLPTAAYWTWALWRRYGAEFSSLR